MNLISWISSFGSVLGALWDIRKLDRGILIWEVVSKKHSEKKKAFKAQHNDTSLWKNSYLLRQSDKKGFQRQIPNRPLKRWTDLKICYPRQHNMFRKLEIFKKKSQIYLLPQLTLKVHWLNENCFKCSYSWLIMYKTFLGSIFHKPFITQFTLAQIYLSSCKISGQILKHIILSKVHWKLLSHLHLFLKKFFFTLSCFPC